jgi:two-component system LytT family sensor kinase
VGLANVRQRLALHYAPADYDLAISQGPETYEVLLTLRLAPVAAQLAPPTTLTRHD